MAVIRDFIDGPFGDDEKEPVGIGGFLTAAQVRQVVKKTRQAPVTYLEDGSHINDHIIRDPLTLSIEGNVSNVFQLPSPAIAALQDTQAQAGNITQYLPSRTQTQISKVSGLVGDVTSAIDFVDAAIENAGRVAGALGFTGDEGKTNTEKFIDAMDGIYNSGALISIDMPFRTHPDMCITSWEYSKDSTTDSITFTIEAQQFRFASSIFADAGPAPAASAANEGQQDGLKDKGVQEGAEVPESFASQIKNAIGF